MKFKLLDCTLRDGGYYTDWDFDKALVDDYFESMNNLPIEYIEIGYRSTKINNQYLGEYFYLPKKRIEEIRKISKKKLAVILNEKDIRPEHLNYLMSDFIGLIDMVRIAIDPKNIIRSIDLAKGLKEMGFTVGFNVMYMSNWLKDSNFLKSLNQVNNVADYFYMVDSYGGVCPEDVEKIYKEVKKHINVKIGFHGHNNLELGLINSITAIHCGVDIIDATITGMGRGAGNLKMELLLTFLHSKGYVNVDFNKLSKIVEPFTNIQKTYGWGTTLPYMVSGANSLPQKDVMEWVGKRFYSFNSIIRALNNKSEGLIDNYKLEIFNSNKNYKDVLIVGGGQSVDKYSTNIIEFLSKKNEILIIHSSSRNSGFFIKLSNRQIFCLVGNEGHRMEEVFSGRQPSKCMCILPPYPRVMGTYIPENMLDKSFELQNINLKSQTEISHTTLALQTALNVNSKNIYLVGYDGYDKSLSKKEQDLFAENENLFAEMNKLGISLTSLTKTSYKNLNYSSIFSEI